MVCAVMLGLANVMKGSTVTVAQVNIIIYHRYFAIFFAFADQGPLVAELANVSTIPLTELELFIKSNDLTLVDMNQNTIFLEFIHF